MLRAEPRTHRPRPAGHDHAQDGGAETFRRLRGLAPAIKVLLTSGYTQKESLESLADLPPDGFLQKPFRVRELVGKVREILRKSDGKSKNK